MSGTVRLNALIDRIATLLPNTGSTVAADLRKNLRAALSSALARMDLVTREEFDVQTAVLTRTYQRLQELEKQIVALEQALAERSEPPRDG
ncbi:MAG: accessory factor UbiK family protein [Chromatiales bacterium]